MNKGFHGLTLGPTLICYTTTVLDFDSFSLVVFVYQGLNMTSLSAFWKFAIVVSAFISFLQSKQQCRRGAIFKHFAEPLRDCNGTT